MKRVALTLVLIVTIVTAALAQSRAPENPFAVGLSLNTTLNKFGAGARFSYNFTPMVRLVGDINYYPWGPNSTKVFDLGEESHSIIGTHTIPASTPYSTIYSGRYIDVNTNVNILFGKRNFHFYLIGGLGYVYGIQHTTALSHQHIAEVTGDTLGSGIDLQTLKYAHTIGINLGTGFEYQLKPSWRIYLELQGSVCHKLILNAATLKLGASFCF